jgi:hypothetical protein
MATTRLSHNKLRVLLHVVWLCQAVCFGKSVARAHASDLCLDQADELLIPSAWCTTNWSSYLTADPSELLTPEGWRDESVVCRMLLEPFEACVPEPELVTPREWSEPEDDRTRRR